MRIEHELKEQAHDTANDALWIIQARKLMYNAAAKITADRNDFDRFHYLMKKHDWHPGRTDDNLLDILDVKLNELQLKIKELETNNKQLAKDAARYQWLKRNPEWLGWDHDFRPDEVECEIDRSMAS